MRCPRRFSQPDWIPLQTLSPHLDNQLIRYLQQQTTKAKRGRSMAKGAQTTGVRVTCSGGSVGGIDVLSARSSLPPDNNGESDTEGEFDAEEVDEKDEMLWWSWNAAKLRGFSDW
jgi:hypothetical protein